MAAVRVIPVPAISRRRVLRGVGLIAVAPAILSGSRWPNVPARAAWVSPIPRQLRGLGLDQAALDTIAQTIQRVEGYYPGTLAYINNNPGNLTFVGQAGAVPGAGGFAKFPTYDAGYQALESQIQNYEGRGLTISQMMNIYAPSSDPRNNPGAYASQIASSLGVSPDTPLSVISTDTGGALSLPADAGGFDFSGMFSGVDSSLLWAAGLGFAAWAVTR